MVDFDFLSYSAQLGSDPMHVQGAGGNTSIKSDSNMCIKASGRCLSDSLYDNTFVNVNLDKSNPSSGDWYINSNSLVKNNLRPSIETMMHSCLPHKYVIHTHYINAIAFSISQSLKDRLSLLLNDFSWSFISYCKPGSDLALCVKDAYEVNGSNVFLLQNHGIVVAGETIEEISNILLKLESLLFISPRNYLQPDMKRLIALSDYVPNSFLPSDLNLHTLALDDTAFHLVSLNPPSPDHVVFCGRKPYIIKTLDDIVLSELIHYNYIVYENVGVLLLSSPGKGLEVMLSCLNDLYLRICPNELPSLLSDQQCYELENWDAEKYRKNSVVSSS